MLGKLRKFSQKRKLLNWILKDDYVIIKSRGGFSGGPLVKSPTVNTGELGSIPGSVRSPGEHGNTYQYSCLDNPMDRGASWATVPGVAKSGTRLGE